MRLRFAAFVAVLVALLAWPSRARAGDVIQDRGELTIDLTAADACFIRPAHLRRPEPCVGFTPEAVDVPSKIDGQDMVVLGLVHLPSGVAGQVLVMRQTSDFTRVDRTIAERYVEGFAKGGAKSVSTTAKARSSKIAIKQVGTTGFVRASIDLSDTKTGVIVPAFAHQELLLVFTKGATYIIASMGPEAETAALEEIVDDVMASAVVTHPLSVTEGQDLSYLLGKMTAYVLIGGGIIAAAIYSHRRSKRQEELWRAQQAAHYHAPPQYPHQYPPYHPQWQPPPNQQGPDGGGGPRGY